MVGELLDDHGSRPPRRAHGARVGSRAASDDTSARDASVAQGRRIQASSSQTACEHPHCPHYPPWKAPGGRREWWRRARFGDGEARFGGGESRFGGGEARFGRREARFGLLRARACRRRLRARGGGRGGGSLLLHTLLEETGSGCRSRTTVRDLNR